MTEKSDEFDELDRIAEDLRELHGGRNLRTETAQLLAGTSRGGWTSNSIWTS